MNTSFISEPARKVPVLYDADICVVGGSCTGLFAAVRAARPGARVVLVEKLNCFGGTATASMVNIWHTPMNTTHERRIIGGLTTEVMDRLMVRDAVRRYASDVSRGWEFNSEELKIELDELVVENKIHPILHAFYSSPVIENDKVTAILVETKSGRGAIRASVFIDATGDGDLCRSAGIESIMASHLHPPTTCAKLSNWGGNDEHVNALLNEHRETYNLPEGFLWGAYVPGSDVYMLAGTRIYGVNTATTDDLTRAEIEGRRQVRAILDIVERFDSRRVRIEALPSNVGTRETYHIRSEYRMTGDDVLYGTRFNDAVANGSYRVDIHHQDKPGITFRYLDGTQVYLRPGYPKEIGRWRETIAEDPTFYQIPLRSLIPEGPLRNLLMAGRMLDADPIAYSALRVMVNMNQMGEAAGVAAWSMLDEGLGSDNLDAQKIRKLLEKGGSVVI